MNSDPWRQQTKKDIDQELRRFLNTKQRQAAKIDSHYLRLLQTITELVSRGGKRLRPLLCLLAYEGYGGQNHQAARRAAIGQELFHAFILMHDDIIDRDERRWGGPNITGVMKPQLRHLAAADTQHHAESWALLAGDVCFGLSQASLLSSGFPANDITRAMAVMEETLFAMVGGELVDVALTIFTDTPPTEAQLLNVAVYKTATYSFIAPLKIGALLAGAPDSELKRLESFGRHLGIVFQLQDDILGMFGDSSALGKPVGNDLREGKRTLLLSYGLALTSGAAQASLRNSLGKAQLSPKQFQHIQQILVSCGALSATQAIIAAELTLARRQLRTLQLTPSSRQHLSEILDTLLVAPK